MSSLKPDNAIEIFLQPGEWYFGDRDTRIRTVLGSCVSMVFWHPKLHIGGMCHYMLPHRPHREFGDLDGRYGDEAVALMFREMRQSGTLPTDYQVKLFGGANMFAHARGKGADPGHVGLRNVEAAREIVKAHGLICACEHMAGVGHRNVIFDVWSGNVWVRHQDLLRSERVAVGADHGLACITLDRLPGAARTVSADRMARTAEQKS